MPRARKPRATPSGMRIGKDQARNRRRLRRSTPDGPTSARWRAWRPEDTIGPVRTASAPGSRSSDWRRRVAMECG